MQVPDEAVQAALARRADLLSDRPDPMVLSEERLTREMLEAAADVMGRAESVMTEWGVRYDGTDPRVIPYGTSRNSERMARLDAATDRETVVRRSVTYGPWEVPTDDTAPQ